VHLILGAAAQLGGRLADVARRLADSYRILRRGMDDWIGSEERQRFDRSVPAVRFLLRVEVIAAAKNEELGGELFGSD
jgi:hypothetical protein